MRLLLLTALIFWQGLAAAQEPACANMKPFFYKVEKNGKTSYLLGTMHAGIPLASFPLDIYGAFGSANVIFLEDDRDKIKETMGPFLKRAAKLPEGKSLRGSLSPAALDKLKQLYGEKSLNILMQYQPWAISNLIETDVEEALTKKNGTSWNFDDSIDTYLARKSKELGKPIELLDKDRDYVADFQSYTTASDLDALLRRPDPMAFIAKCSEDMRRVYCDGNESGIETMMKTDCETEGIKSVLVRRTHAWIPHLKSSFEQGGAFAAVGAGHLTGPDGLLQILRSQDFTITRVDTFTAAPMGGGLGLPAAQSGK